MAVNGARLWQNLLALSAITEPDKPYTRRSFSPRFLEGRQWLTAQMQAAGLETRIDSAGNLIGRLPGNGRKAGVIAIGSHSDSVPSGGRFDGIAGVLTALECAQSWHEQGITLNHDVEIVLAAETLAQEMAARGAGYVVATCGQIFATPNASNVIAGETRLVFDIRSDQRALMLHYLEQLQARAEGITARRGIAIARWAQLTDSSPVLADGALMAHLQVAADAVGARQITLPSSAGHDSAFLAHIAPMVMLFVPSKDGKSHCPEEWTDADALAKGAAVLQAGIEGFDGE